MHDSKSLTTNSFTEKLVGNGVARFEEDEIRLGTILGRGEFGVIRSLQSISLSKDFNAANEHENSLRKKMSMNLMRNSEMNSKCKESKQKQCQEMRYAVKSLRADIMMKYFSNKNDRKLDGSNSHSDKHRDVVMDVLAIEAKILSEISHPNIIRLRAISNDHPLSSSFFIVLDRLKEILSDRINLEWRPLIKRLYKGKFINSILKSRENERNLLLLQQLEVASDLVSAMCFLHKNWIIYRDLKTDNIGFDVRGNVKLFDFGLSKRLNPSEEGKLYADLYQLTGQTGSLRYMAPEVFQNKAYNAFCDVYSFGILLFEIMTGIVPFENMGIVDYTKEIIMKGKRPPIPKHFIDSYLGDLMLLCWSSDIDERLRFKQIGTVLGKEIKILECELDVKDPLWQSLSRSQKLLNASMNSLYNK